MSVSSSHGFTSKRTEDFPPIYNDLNVKKKLKIQALTILQATVPLMIDHFRIPAKR
jgi:hypothetical protein